MQLMRAETSVMNPAFLHLHLNALPESGGTIGLQTASTNIRNIKASEYVKLDIPVPTLAQQEEWVSRASERRASEQRLAEAVQAAGRRAKSLRRALLAAAFSGRLTGRSSDLDRAEELAGV
jgi:type I restriction enzyme S subunit